MPKPEALTELRSFEIHTKHLGEWKYDSNFDDPDLAIEEARKLEQRGQFQGVRVIEETFEENSPMSRIRVIFTTEPLDRGRNSLSDGGTFGAHDNAGAADSDTGEVESDQSDGPETIEGGRGTGRRPGEQSPLMLGLILVLILGLGLAVLVGLEYLIHLADDPKQKAVQVLPFLIG